MTTLDCAILDPERGLVGQSWIVDIELEGPLDAQSMVADFGTVKTRIKNAIDGSLDHTLLIPAHSPALRLDQQGSQMTLSFQSAIGLIEHASPPIAVTLLDCERIDSPLIETALSRGMRDVIPRTIPRIGVRLREESIDGAHYCYGHGLRKHRGHCQRIAHGHRSRLEIRLDGQRDPILEQECASRWSDIYLASTADLLGNREGRLHFGYAAPEGYFELTLPESRCEILETDTTVEEIAGHLARHCAQRRPEHCVEVRAYEGVHKGAVERIVGPGCDSTTMTPLSYGDATTTT